MRFALRGGELVQPGTRDLHAWVTLSPWGGIAPPACEPVPSPLSFLGHMSLTYQTLDVKPVASGSLVNADVTDLKGKGERKSGELDK